MWILGLKGLRPKRAQLPGYQRDFIGCRKSLENVLVLRFIIYSS